MNFEQDCVSLLWLGSIFSISGVVLYYVHKTDRDFSETEAGRVGWMWFMYSVAAGLVLWSHCNNGEWFSRVAYALLAVYLILCCVMDSALKLVCDFFHGIGILGGSIYLLGCNPEKEALEALILFAGIQWFIFRKMYGPADMAAYVVCSTYLAAEGGGLLDYLLHMLITFGVLGLAQLWKRNISAKGNLKSPVALLPYITVAFFLII